MGRVFISSSLVGTSTEDLQSALMTILQQFEDQINAGVAIASLTNTNQALPQGMISGDIIFDIRQGELRIGIYNGVTVLYASFGSFTGAITDSQHGTRSGGSLHPIATTSVAGFMSAGDKTKSDHYKGSTSSSAPPSLTEFPSNGDYGFHTDITGPTYYLAFNFSGTIKSTLLT